MPRALHCCRSAYVALKLNIRRLTRAPGAERGLAPQGAVRRAHLTLCGVAAWARPNHLMRRQDDQNAV